MPTSGSRAVALLDTSAAVAFLLLDHPHHEATFTPLAERDLGLAGHAAFETFSVLTRLPPPARRTPAAVRRLLSSNFPHSRFLSSQRTAAVLAELATHGLAGGAVYDALVGTSAVEHGLTLFSRDQRALPTYRRLRVDVEMIG